MATINLNNFASAPMRHKWANQGHKYIHMENQGASEIWILLHTLQ